MAVGEVEDVDVVTDSGSVARVVVCLSQSQIGASISEGGERTDHRRTLEASRAFQWQPAPKEGASCKEHPEGLHP